MPLMPVFTSNYPVYEPGHSHLLPTPERIDALPDYTGRGVTLAFIDSGFYPHPDLGERVLVHVDATTHKISEGALTKDKVSDLSWHGQMTSVIAAGDGHSSGGRYRGAASAASLVLIKVSSPRGLIKEADILRGLEWLVGNHARYNVRVLNMSVGGDFESNNPNHEIYQAVRALVEAGVTVVAAAGNRGTRFLVPPASTPEAITVGGFDDHNSLDESLWTTYHSNYGTAYDGTAKPEICAPAVWIASPILPGSSVAREAYWLGPLLETRDRASLHQLLKKGYADLGLSRGLAMRPDDNVYSMLQARINTHKIIDANHQHVDGTSVSAAIASSVVAQMLEANSKLKPAQIRELLLSTAKRLPNVPHDQQGGVMDAAAAVLAAGASSK
jgi:serine protease AprX